MINLLALYRQYIDSCSLKSKMLKSLHHRKCALCNFYVNQLKKSSQIKLLSLSCLIGIVLMISFIKDFASDTT